eukprot:g81938.t1
MFNCLPIHVFPHTDSSHLLVVQKDRVIGDVPSLGKIQFVRKVNSWKKVQDISWCVLIWVILESSLCFSQGSDRNIHVCRCEERKVRFVSLVSPLVATG